MTIPSRPAPPPPSQQQQQHQQNTGGGSIRLPPPPTSKSSSKTYHTTRNKIISNQQQNNIPLASVISVSSSSSSITRKFPTAKTHYASTTNNQDCWNDDPFEMITKSVENSNVKKKTPPPRPPPPKSIDNNVYNNFGATDTTTTKTVVLKKPGPIITNIFGKRIKNLNSNNMKQQQQQQFPPHKYPPLSNTSSAVMKSSSIIGNQQITKSYQSRPYAFVPPLVRNCNENELISFDSPPNSPLSVLKKSNSDCISVGSSYFSSDSNFSSPNNGSIATTQSESGFEDDFTSPPPDPWESIIGDVDGIYNSSNTSSHHHHHYTTTNDFKISQPVRNLNAVNNLKGDDILSNGKSLLPPPPTLQMPTIIKPKTSQYSSCGSNLIMKKNPAPKAPPSSLMMTNKDVFDYGEYEQNHLHEGSPPMPSCPPPPPPPQPLLPSQEEILSIYSDECSDDIDPSQPSYGIALYNFDGIEEGDLSFKENEKVYLLQKLNDKWYFGRNKRGCEGIFPSNYIHIKIPLQEANNHDGIATASSAIKTSSNNYSDNGNNSKNKSITESQLHSHERHEDNVNSFKAKSLYTFIGEVPDDLSLNENDIVTVLYRINDDWLYGEIEGRQGQFPANFVEFLHTK